MRAFAIAAWAACALAAAQEPDETIAERKQEATRPEKGKKESDETAELKVERLQAREVIERLKTMRAQILLDEEYNRLLEVRLKRMELERALASGGAAKKGESPGRSLPPPPTLEGDRQLAVKSVTVSPFKEAFVVYKGRFYTVRPGDRLGDIVIRDINDSGIVTDRSAVMLEK